MEKYPVVVNPVLVMNPDRSDDHTGITHRVDLREMSFKGSVNFFRNGINVLNVSRNQMVR
jgi:hypothetical protein